VVFICLNLPVNNPASVSVVFPLDLRARIRAAGIVAVVVLERVVDAAPLANALRDGGVSVVELALRTPVSIEALVAFRAAAPDFLLGAGTVLSPQQVSEARAAGADFGVAPGLNHRVLQAAAELSWPFAPGVATASDIEAGLEHGCRFMKFFPAGTAGGPEHLATLATPYLHEQVSFLPLGGLSPDNAVEWSRLPMVEALGGSWIAPRESILTGDWRGIARRAGEGVALVRQARLAVI